MLRFIIYQFERVEWHVCLAMQLMALAPFDVCKQIGDRQVSPCTPQCLDNCTVVPAAAEPGTGFPSVSPPNEKADKAHRNGPSLSLSRLCFPNFALNRAPPLPPRLPPQSIYGFRAYVDGILFYLLCQSRTLQTSALKTLPHHRRRSSGCWHILLEPGSLGA